jgi:hypothetical protein
LALIHYQKTLVLRGLISLRKVIHKALLNIISSSSLVQKKLDLTGGKTFLFAQQAHAIEHDDICSDTLEINLLTLDELTSLTQAMTMPFNLPELDNYNPKQTINVNLSSQIEQLNVGDLLSNMATTGLATENETKSYFIAYRLN